MPLVGGMMLPVHINAGQTFSLQLIMDYQYILRLRMILWYEVHCAASSSHYKFRVSVCTLRVCHDSTSLIVIIY